MSETMKEFLKAVSADRELAEKAKTMDKDALISMAKEMGFELTEADFTAPEGEMSQKELAGISGGGACYCAVGGGGTKGEEDSVCACVGDGFGFVNDGGMRCMCTFAGYGE